MNEEIKERQSRFLDDIQVRINYHIRENHFTYAEIIGMIEILKIDHAQNWLSDRDNNETN